MKLKYGTQRSGERYFCATIRLTGDVTQTICNEDLAQATCAVEKRPRAHPHRAQEARAHRVEDLL